MGEPNKVKYDLAAAYFAPVKSETDGTVTYDAPERIPGAVSVSLSAEGDESNFRADGMVYIRSFTNSGYSGDLELALVPDSFREKCLGEELDSGGVILEREDAEHTPFALLLEFKADKKRIRHVFYYCTAARPSVEGENPDSKEPKTETLAITATPRADGLVKGKTTESTGEEAYNGFFTKVYEPGEIA